MARKVPRKKLPEKKSKAKAGQKVTPIGWDRSNLAIMAFGVIVIAIGYVMLARGSITLAPLLLVFGYCVVFPVGISWSTGFAGNLKARFGVREQEPQQAAPDGPPGS
jgi:hypothetical protein